MGASGVQMGTRFVTTVECDASDEFKQIYLDSKENNIKIISSPVGMPGRAIENKFLIDVKNGLKKPFKCPYHCIITCDYKNAPYCIANALINAKNGRLNHGFAFAGANAYKTDKIITVKELIDLLVSEYESAAK
ncbi:MAG: nitronate monooxygenase, partial [Bacteroidales bacterium]|nr:nitronate monooxygenase [Bacteroidales bacterium]